MDYFDKNGEKITEGMYLRFGDGSVEQVYACEDAYGNQSLGINASNDAYMQTHGLSEYDREFYPLSNFNLHEVEICDPELAHTGYGTMKPL